MVMWVMGLWMGNARPCALGRKRLIVGPSSATASRTIRSSADRLRLFSAFAVALLSTRATSLAAVCGMNRRAAAASSTGMPLIASVMSRAFRVGPRRYFAAAETRIVTRLPQPGGPVGGPAVPAIRAGGRALAGAMADHVRGD